MIRLERRDGSGETLTAADLTRRGFGLVREVVQTDVITLEGVTYRIAGWDASVEPTVQIYREVATPAEMIAEKGRLRGGPG